MNCTFILQPAFSANKFHFPISVKFYLIHIIHIFFKLTKKVLKVNLSKPGSNIETNTVSAWKLGFREACGTWQIDRNGTSTR